VTRMTPSEAVAKALQAAVQTACLDALRPTMTSGELNDITSKHLATALDMWRDEIVSEVRLRLRGPAAAVADPGEMD
jgi:hypothetical protein